MEGGPRAVDAADQLSCVLFDLDNTLVPFFPALQTWARVFADELAPRATRSRVAADMLAWTFERGEDPRGALVTASRELGLASAEVEAAAETAHRAYLDVLRPYPGIPRVLSELAGEGLRLAVVTDAPGARALERLDASGLADRFETVITRDMSPQGKRGPEPYHMVLGELGLGPETAAMVGDHPPIDAAWPNRLGMLSVLAGWGRWNHGPPRSPWERPRATAARPEQVPAILRDPPPRPERPLTDYLE